MLMDLTKYIMHHAYVVINDKESSAEWIGTADVVLKWLLTHKGNSDVLWAGDGRNRNIRRKLDAAFDNARLLHEAWVVFTPTPRVGRKLAFSADRKTRV